MPKRIYSDNPFENAIGYCRAVVTPDGWIHISGTTGVDYETGQLPDDVGEQCHRAFGHIGAALKEAGAGFRDIVRIRMILPDRDDFKTCVPILRDRLGAAPPAATMIQAELLDPRMKVEIEVTAWRNPASDT